MRLFRWSIPFALLAALAACGGGGGSAGGDADDDLSDLVLIDVSVGGNDGVALNQIITLEFSEAVTPGTVTPETVRVRIGPNFAKQVPGSYSTLGNLVEFHPRLPTQADLSDSGLLPGSTYEIRLPGGDAPNSVRNAAGDGLREEQSRTFATAVASSKNLFIDYFPDEAPHITSVNPKPDAVDVPQSIDVEMTFNEPLLPATVNTSNFKLTMTHRPPGTPLLVERPIQGTMVLEQSPGSVVVKFVPLFPLADDATYRLEVDRRVTDLVGNDIVAHTSSFSIRDEPPVASEFVLEFDDSDQGFEDIEASIASWNRDVEDAVAGIFTAGAGDGSDGDFKPSFNTQLNGDLQPNATFNFRVIEIPNNVTVTVTGSEPVTIKSLASVQIEGTLDASGEKGGTQSDSKSSSWSFPNVFGGQGGPGGGDGGDATTAGISSRQNSRYVAPDADDGSTGYGTTGTNGKGGEWGSGYYYKAGSGGGGGGHQTAGEDGERTRRAGSISTYQNYGGDGGDAFGNADLIPMTAGGGGGTGTHGYYYYYPWNQGSGAGGGGGGAITLVTANNLDVNGGRILAEGGDGGDQTGLTGPYAGGSGGAGAGGAIYLKSLRSITLTNATVSAAGGEGGTNSATLYAGFGGDGGDGYLRIHDGDGQPTLSGAVQLNPNNYGKGTFVASGKGAPSVSQTLWVNVGVFDPVFSEPQIGDDIIQVIPKATQTISYEIQMAPEDIFDLGTPDESRASAWTPIEDIETLNGNGYSFFKLRITFELADDQEIDDPVPYVERFRLQFTY